ncbi:MAG: threonine aldolase [Fusobacteriia bacterium 4572_74]|nr:MAG: threonine aldolase [Fusobacteriia bacterium 4572_74]
MEKKSFASDNYSGVHPKIMEALIECNVGHAKAYGEDRYTQKAIEKFKEIFGQEIYVDFLYNGTGANTVALDAMTESFQSVICPEQAHINTYEVGAPTKFTGCSMIGIKASDVGGKLKIERVKDYLKTTMGSIHHSQPRVISITQPTEIGSVYTLKEIAEIADFAHENGLLLHMDGARIFNAAESLDVGFKEMTKDLGVDVLSFGGTKNGMMFGEAVVFFDTKLAKNVTYRKKQCTQLNSKMRYITAQFTALLEDGLGLKNARQSNNMAKLLADSVSDIPGVKITNEVEANTVYAVLPKKIIPILQEKYYFYVWDIVRSEVRWVTSFDITEEDVIDFAEQIRSILEKTKKVA